MKKILFAISLFTAVTGFLSSCTKDFEEINTDPNDISTVSPQQLLAPALVNTLSLNMLRNRNFNNELMQVTVNPSDAEGQVFRYDYRSNWSDNLYNGWYAQLTNFKDVYRIASDTSGVYYNKSYMAISLICQSWIYSLLTDTYGDVPYFQSNMAKAENGGITEPVFDKQKDIYLDIFKKLDTANVLLNGGPAIVGSADPLYNGNISKWRKFGNSLYLRLLMRLSGKAEVSADVIAKFKDIAETNAPNYPLISSNDESAILKWSGVPPYTSPYLAVREQDWRQVGLATFFLDHLVIWNDPRIDISLGSNGINRWAIAPFQGSFTGIPSGYVPGTVPERKSYFYSTTSTSTLMTEPLAGMILNYAEVKFIMAEAALKGWITSSAETHYNDGVLNSIKQWLPTWNVPISTYLTAADMQWSTATTFDDKMERIHLQKYYALFLNDLQQWFEYRRTGRPTLPKGAGLKNNGEMPSRMVYPVYVQSTNPTNYKLAIAAQGMDEISTKVWWQKP